MRMHDREWYAVACRPRATSRQSKSLRFLRGLTKNMALSWSDPVVAETSATIAQFEMVSSRRYFLITESDTELTDFLSREDTPRLIRTRQHTRFGYTGYVASMDTQALRGALIVLLPYAGLAREFWHENIMTDSPTELSFIRSDIGGLFKVMQKHRSDTANLQLKLGRALVHNDPNARVITLRGQNILDSQLYRLLFGPAARTSGLTFDDTYSRIGYYPSDGRGLTIFLDRYGNLRARPGNSGVNTSRLFGFLQQLDRLGLLQSTNSCPILRFNVEEEV